MSNIQKFIIEPRSLTEAMELAKMISNSNFCPTAMKNKPGDVIIAMQMGSEVGLSPMQALQNIAVINGKPCLYGDAALAVAMSSTHYICHREWEEGSIADGTLTAYCAVTRKNSEEYIKSFSMDDAKKAGLWSKSGVWQQYPNRMLQMRARAFAIRDQFADALRGINIREEVEDYVVIQKQDRPKMLQATPTINIEEIIEPKDPTAELGSFLDLCSLMDSAIDLAFLADAFKKAKNKFKDTDYMTRLIECKDINKARIEASYAEHESVQQLQEEDLA